MTDGPLLLPTLRQVSRDTLQDQVYRQIREALMSGRFQPGQKLTIRGLAEALRPLLTRSAALEAQQTAAMRVPAQFTMASVVRNVRDVVDRVLQRTTAG